MADDARAVANKILTKAWSEGRSLTQLDVHKLMYFLHGHALIDTGKPLVSTEFAAWDYGPVQPPVYRIFKKFGDCPITELAMAFDPVRRTLRELSPIDDPAALRIIDQYLGRYLRIDTFLRVDLTHRPGTPWSITRDRARRSANIGMRIPDALIAEAFEGRRNRTRQNVDVAIQQESREPGQPLPFHRPVTRGLSDR